MRTIGAHSTEIVNALNYRYHSDCSGTGKQIDERSCIDIDGVLYARCPDCTNLQPLHEVDNEENSDDG